jgi:hypothetical protein
MTQDYDAQRENVRSKFTEVINSQGYGFHHSVIREVVELFKSTKSNWIFEAVEFPVEVQNFGTRVDFILRYQEHNYYNNPSAPVIYILGECKRVNPAFNWWCFAQSTFFKRYRSSEPFMLEQINIHQGSSVNICNYSIFKKNLQTTSIYNVATEVKTNNQGDRSGQGAGKHIEDAAGQVLKGMNGFAQFISNHPEILNKEDKQKVVILLPVIFTTAELWTTAIDISQANIETGNIELTKESLNKKPWLLYQYHQTPSIKHLLNYQEADNSLGGMMDLEYVRTLSIVNSSGIESFLEWAQNIINW